MKIEQTALEIERSGNFKERGFGIASNAKAFDILSSKIYTDVFLAIVRELSTNASDSHTDAGCPEKPFDVHLPNSLEPWLMIRDYGTGLSPQDVETVYTTYFRSTRTGSDDFTGCLGLGSKSPFAYTDQFSIISNWNGRQYTYSAFKNESDCPALALLGEAETTEPNGLEIRIPIKPGDSSNFLRAAQRVYPHFKVRPNIVGATIQFDVDKPIVVNEHFALYKALSTGKISVVMGQVCYVVDHHQFPCDLGYEASLVLYMPTGSCSIAASREEIHYDPRTLQNVRNAVQNACLTAKIELEKRLTDSSCVFAKLNELYKFNSLVKNLSFKGTRSVPCHEDGKYSMREATLRRGEKLYIYPSSYENLGGGEKQVIFIEEDIADITQNTKNRLRQYMRLQGRADFHLVKIEDVARFAEIFGSVTTKLSLLPDVPKIQRQGSTATRSKPIKLLCDSAHRNMGGEWVNCTDATLIDPTDACCVPRDGNWIVWNGSRVSPDKIRQIAKVLGFKRVYGIAEKRYATSRVRYKLVELCVVAKAKMEELIATLDQYAISKFTHTTHTHGAFDYKKLQGLSKECDNFIRVSEADISKVHDYCSTAATLGVEIPKVENFSATFFKKYPILVAIDWYRGNNVMNEIIEYIKLKEQVHE